MQCCIGNAQWCYEMLKGHLGVFYWCCTSVVKKSGAGNVCFCVAACVHTFFPSMMDHIFKLHCHVQAKGSGELVGGCFFGDCNALCVARLATVGANHEELAPLCCAYLWETYRKRLQFSEHLFPFMHQFHSLLSSRSNM